MARTASSAVATKRLLERISAALDMVRPALQSDGGDVELIRVDAAGVVYVRLIGACVGCPSSDMTLTLGIERTIKEQVPEVTGIACE